MQNVKTISREQKQKTKKKKKKREQFGVNC